MKYLDPEEQLRWVNLCTGLSARGTNALWRAVITSWEDVAKKESLYKLERTRECGPATILQIVEHAKINGVKLGWRYPATKERRIEYLLYLIKASQAKIKEKEEKMRAWQLELNQLRFVPDLNYETKNKN